MTGDAATRLRRQIYGLMAVITVAAVVGRTLNVERVFEPSIYRADSAPDLGSVALLLAAVDPLADATLLAVASDAWSRIDANAPARNWPRSRPAISPTFSSNDKSRWAMIRALVDQGTFVIGDRSRDADGRIRDTGIVFEDGWQSIDKVLHPERQKFYSSKPPLLPVMAAGEYWLLQKLFGWRLDRDTGKVICTILLTFNAIPLAIYLLVLARIVERYGSTDWGRLFTFAAACFATFLTTFANTLNNHTVAAYTTLFAVAPLLLGWTTLAGVVGSGLFAGLTAAFELPAAAFLVALAAAWLWHRGVTALLAFGVVAAIPIAAQLALNYAELGDWKPAYEKTDSVWYRYEGSHWNQQKGERRGIDYAGDQETRRTYAFHLLLGHHGWFSLTPVWLLSLLGWIRAAASRNDSPNWRLVHGIGAVTSVIVIVFFAAIVGTVNYGGWTSGARWFFWLTPFWLLALLPSADMLASSKMGRGISLVLLALSVVSVNFPAWNPWRHPWIYRAMEAWGWKGY